MTSERVQRQIDRLLDEAESALTSGDWVTARLRSKAVLRIEPGNADATTYLQAATRDDSTGAAGPAPQSAAAPVRADSQPTSFANGRYAVSRFLGEGGKKKVYLAHDAQLIDRRPDREMAAYCQANDVQLLAYGTLAGSLLSERYLGSPEPDRGQLNTASLQKYKQMIDLWGEWPLFQDLLAVLKRVADRSNVSIANVAVRYVMGRPAVAGVIVGVRLGVSDNLAENEAVFGLSLSSEDIDAIDAVLARGQDLFQLIGDCGDEYRR